MRLKLPPLFSVTISQQYRDYTLASAHERHTYVQENAVLYADKEKSKGLSCFRGNNCRKHTLFYFGSDEIIHQVSNDAQTKVTYYQDFQDYVYKPLVVADENTNTQQKSSKLGTVCATPIVAGFSSSL